MVRRRPGRAAHRAPRGTRTGGDGDSRSALARARRRRREARFWARPAEPHAARLRELAPQAETRADLDARSLPGAPDWVALGMTGTVRTGHVPRWSRRSLSPPCMTAARGRWSGGWSATGSARCRWRWSRLGEVTPYRRVRWPRVTRWWRWARRCWTRPAACASSGGVPRLRFGEGCRGRTAQSVGLGRAQRRADALRVILLLALPALAPGSARPRGGPLLHPQGDGGLRVNGPARRGGDAGPGRRPDREQAAGPALARPARRPIPGRARHTTVVLQRHHAPARGAGPVVPGPQEGRRHRPAISPPACAAPSSTTSTPTSIPPCSPGRRRQCRAVRQAERIRLRSALPGAGKVAIFGEEAQRVSSTSCMPLDPRRAAGCILDALVTARTPSPQPA